MPEFSYEVPNFGEMLTIYKDEGSNQMGISFPDNTSIGFPLENEKVLYERLDSYGFIAYGKTFNQYPNDKINCYNIIVQAESNIFNLTYIGNDSKDDVLLYATRFDEVFLKTLNVIFKALSLGLTPMPSQEQLNRIVTTYSFESDDEISFSNTPSNTLTTRNIPAGSTNSVMMNAIEDGNIMANFHDEFSHGRYYKKSTYNALPKPKKNPYSRIPITSKTNYKAKIVGAAQEGGRKRVVRKTRKGRKGVKK
jgi:hypothetical protein